MKRRFYLMFTCFSCSIYAFAQSPRALNYQAIARNNSGQILINQPVNIRCSILDSSINGASQYAETQYATTNQFGLFTAAIGTGTVISGSLANVTWATNNKYLKV